MKKFLNQQHSVREDLAAWDKLFHLPQNEQRVPREVTEALLNGHDDAEYWNDESHCDEYEDDWEETFDPVTVVSKFIAPESLLDFDWEDDEQAVPDEEDFWMPEDDEWG